MDESLYTQFDNTFFEKTRLSMITIIFQEKEISFNELKKRLGGTDGAVYTHLEKLIKAGYVKKQREIAGNAVQTVYELTKEGIEAFMKYLEFLEQMVNRLDEEKK